MPHFFAKSLDSLESVKNRSGEYFDFILEAINLRDKSTLILAQNKSDSAQKIMLLKQQKNDKFLVKFNKHFKVQSREAIKNALKDYAKLTNADIIAHNLNANKAEAQSKYLLDSRGILGLFDSQNVGESDSIDSHESSESRESHFKNAPKMVEIGFGSGRHILNLAQNNPNALIIGLEIYRPAILQVLRQIELLGLQNLYLVSIDARVLFEVLPRESLSAIFLHFPVPWDKNPQRRVFSEVFLSNAIATLKPQEGRFELITDSKEYFDFAKKLARIYKCKITINPQNKVVSKYEARWQRLKKDIYKLEIFPLVGNSPLELHSADSANFECSQTPSLVSHSKFAENHESQTENPSVVDSTQSVESNEKIKSKKPLKSFCYFWLIPKVESPYTSSLRGRIADSHEAIQNFCDSKNGKNQFARSATLKALSGVGVGVVREGEGSDFAIRKNPCIQAPTPSLKKNARRQKGEFNADLSAESCKKTDSNLLLDSRDLDSSLTAFAQNDNRVDCHDSATPNLAMTDNDDSQKLGFLPPKIYKKEYFLQIKDKYEFGGGFVIYVVFGAYYAPNSAYIIVRKNSEYCEILGDIIPTKANLSALNELQFLGSYA